jgi:uncharacterized protein YktB (UPF0637 family)
MVEYINGGYILGNRRRKDRSALTISKVLNGNMYVMATLTDGSADVISLMLDELNKELQQRGNIIKEVREYITSYESISTIQGLEEIEANKDLDEKTLNEMVRRYMIVHDKVLEILDKVDKENNNEKSNNIFRQ